MLTTDTTDTTNSAQNAPTWLTTREMATRVRLHQKTLLRMARAGLIPSLRAGRAVRFPAEAVEQALMGRTTST